MSSLVLHVKMRPRYNQAATRKVTRVTSQFWLSTSPSRMQLMHSLTNNIHKIYSLWGSMTTVIDCFSIKFKSSCLINVPIKVLGNKTSTTVTFTIRHSFCITVKRLMTLTPQYCLQHTPGDTGDGQDANTPCSLSWLLQLSLDHHHQGMLQSHGQEATLLCWRLAPQSVQHHLLSSCVLDVT